MKYFFLPFFFLLIVNHISGANISFQKIPSWVKTIETPLESTVNKYNVSTGFYHRLIDLQNNLAENTSFIHEVREVVSYTGITGSSQLMISFDTIFQKVIIHHLYIWRNGQKIDRTSSITMEMLHNEFNLEEGIYTGKGIAYDNLDDIRKNDLIDFAYSLTGYNPIFGNNKYLLVPLSANDPVGLLSLRVLYDPQRYFQYKFVDCDTLNISVSDIGKLRLIEYSAKNVPGVIPEENSPAWSLLSKYFIMTSFHSWKEVNTWAQEVFALKKEQKLEDVFKEIFRGNETMDEKINKIINYVQDDIRFMGVESGISSIKPFSPEQVVKQRFGDCKGKSLLLVTLLKQIGITRAYPVLVNTYMQDHLESFYPGNEFFNHCIVTFTYDSTNYWIDPSVPVQGGDFKDLYTQSYGKVLIIGIPSDSLSSMPAGHNAGFTELVEELTVTAFDKPATLKVISKRDGFEADRKRMMMEMVSSSELSKTYVKDLESVYPSVVITREMNIQDDLEKNIFTVEYEYGVDGFWQDASQNEKNMELWYFRYEPRTIYDYMNISTCSERKNDYRLLYPQNLKCRLIFNFPADFVTDDSYYTVENKIFYFDEKVEQINPRKLQVDYQFNVKQNCIGTADFKEICETESLIRKNLPLIFIFPK